MSVLKRDPIWGLCFVLKNSDLTQCWYQKPEARAPHPAKDLPISPIQTSRAVIT
jgi:hypothetical protein